MKISFQRPGKPKSGTWVLPVAEWGKATPALSFPGVENLLRMVKAGNFEGKKDQSLDLIAPTSGIDRLILIGLGKSEDLQRNDVEYLGGTIAGLLQSAKCKSAMVGALPIETAKISGGEAASLLASGAMLRCYKFDTYKSKKSPDAPLATLGFETSDVAGARKFFDVQSAIAEGNHLARDLVNEPANVLTPPEFANRTKALAKLGIKLDILTPPQMKKLGMNALLGVAQGSPFEARLVVMRWEGGKKGEQPLAFIGKGVTFDTGGISIKPAASMDEMKGDMGGAACVVGLMHALAKRKAKVNVVGAIGIVENAVDGKAQRPGDVVKSMSGQTIAVLNTDAEGRLVLADVLWYVQDKFKPKFMINLATLTGAILVALGKEHAGLFSNNDELAARLHASGQATDEKVWRMPLTPQYDKLIDHEVADMKNIGGRFAGSITAAQFLQRFVNKVPWAHLDVAGTAMDSNKTPISQSWASGWGVRLLNHLVASHYENSSSSEK